MMQKIRDRISGWVSIVIIALVAGAFMLFGVEYYFQGGSTSDANVAAKVNGSVISVQELSQAVSQLSKRMNVSPTSPMMPQLKAYALESLVTQRAMVTTLEKEDFHVSLSQIKAFVTQIPAFQENGQFSKERFEMILAQLGETPLEFFQRLQSQFVAQQAMQGITASAFALPIDAQRFYLLSHQSRAFGYFLLPMNLFSSSIVIKETDIQNFYKANSPEFETPEKVSFAYLILSPSAIEKTISVTPDEVKAYYQMHLSAFTLPTRYLVSQITIPVSPNASPADVLKAKAAIAKIQTQLQAHVKPSVGSATMTLNDDDIPPALQSILSAMKIGQTSSVLHTEDGFTLLTLQKKEPAETKSFNAVKAQILTVLKHQKVNAILAKQSNTLTNLTYTNPTSLKEAADALNLPIQTTGLMTQQGEKTGPFSTPAVLSALFNPAFLTANNNSNVIGLPDGSQLVVRVLKNIPSQPMPLSSVRDQIQKTLLTQQAVAKAGVLAYQLQMKLLAGVSPQALAKQYHLVWHSVGMMTAQQKSSVPPTILKEAFSIPLSTQKNKMTSVKAFMMGSDAYGVVVVSQVKNPPINQVSEAVIQKSQAALTSMEQQLLQHAFLSSVMQSSKIVVGKNPKVR